MGDQALASATPAQQAAAAAYGPTGVAVPCIPGRPCPQAQQGNMQMQLTPLQQQAQLIAAKERERLDDSRFASNLVYSRSADPPQQQQQGQMMPAQYGPPERQINSSLVPPPAEGKQEDTPGGYKRPLEANVDSAVGQPYLVYEGSVLDTVLSQPRIQLNLTPSADSREYSADVAGDIPGNAFEDGVSIPS
jgi:type IV secretion system protein VirB10